MSVTALLSDPLIQMMMRSDGVTTEEFAALWRRIQDKPRRPVESREPAPAN